jgi:hypothetical protein
MTPSQARANSLSTVGTPLQQKANHDAEPISISPHASGCAWLASPVGAMALIICACIQQSSTSEPRIANESLQQLAATPGLRIHNGINRGTDYTDSQGTKYNLRYIPITITNESTRPIHFQIAFEKEYDYPRRFRIDEPFNVFPMPEEWGMDGVEITDEMINELLRYIDQPSLTKTLEPGEGIVAAIGTRYLPTGRGVLPNALFVQSDRDKFQDCDDLMNHEESQNPQLALGLKLDICLVQQRDPVGCVLIPSGQLSFPER